MEHDGVETMTVFCKCCDQIVVAVFDSEDNGYVLWKCPQCDEEEGRDRTDSIAFEPALAS